MSTNNFPMDIDIAMHTWNHIPEPWDEHTCKRCVSWDDILQFWPTSRHPTMRKRSEANLNFCTHDAYKNELGRMYKALHKDLDPTSEKAYIVPYWLCAMVYAKVFLNKKIDWRLTSKHHNYDKIVQNYTDDPLHDEMLPARVKDEMLPECVPYGMLLSHVTDENPLQEECRAGFNSDKRKMFIQPTLDDTLNWDESPMLDDKSNIGLSSQLLADGSNSYASTPEELEALDCQIEALKQSLREFQTKKVNSTFERNEYIKQHEEDIKRYEAELFNYSRSITYLDNQILFTKKHIGNLKDFCDETISGIKRLSMDFLSTLSESRYRGEEIREVFETL